MTIISVVYVPEGIAMAADSRLTGYRSNENGLTDRFTISDNAQKLLTLKNSTIGVSFCGDAIIEGKTVADFLRIFDIEKVEESDSTQDIANKLMNYLQEKYSKYNVAFLVAGFDNDEPYVFTVNKDKAIRDNFSDEDKQIKYGASWRGEQAPVAKLFYNTDFSFDLMPLKDAVDLSEFIVEVSIKYFRFYDGISTCGGPTDTLVITKDYTEFYRHKILKP